MRRQREEVRAFFRDLGVCGELYRGYTLIKAGRHWYVPRLTDETLYTRQQARGFVDRHHEEQHRRWMEMLQLVH